MGRDKTGLVSEPRVDEQQNANSRTTYLVHHLGTKIRAVNDIRPSVNNTALRIHERLVEIKSIQVESDHANKHGCHPDADNRPSSQEKVESTRIVEGSKLEEQTPKVSMSSPTSNTFNNNTCP